ncbi:hypothetical protein PAPYR_8276 [Paratrimastix pyriformis]|uniref:Uncharacterized protein n=1 Tax=Paratrimastix pyriformis TaxID=342808 RepID=A0ABQ8UGC4_9EUKA|nr:hypothetical protein PAPYR_8276 [Paratrimastix pyriformis]
MEMNSTTGVLMSQSTGSGLVFYPWMRCQWYIQPPVPSNGRVQLVIPINSSLPHPPITVRAFPGGRRLDPSQYSGVEYYFGNQFYIELESYGRTGDSYQLFNATYQTVPAPSVNFTRPAVNETLSVGTLYNISWVTDRIVGLADLWLEAESNDTATFPMLIMDTILEDTSDLWPVVTKGASSMASWPLLALGLGDVRARISMLDTNDRGRVYAKTEPFWVHSDYCAGAVTIQLAMNQPYLLRDHIGDGPSLYLPCIYHFRTPPEVDKFMVKMTIMRYAVTLPGDSIDLFNEDSSSSSSSLTEILPSTPALPANATFTTYPNKWMRVELHNGYVQPTFPVDPTGPFGGLVAEVVAVPHSMMNFSCLFLKSIIFVLLISGTAFLIFLFWLVIIAHLPVSLCFSLPHIHVIPSTTPNRCLTCLLSPVPPVPHIHVIPSTTPNRLPHINVDVKPQIAAPSIIFVSSSCAYLLFTPLPHIRVDVNPKSLPNPTYASNTVVPIRVSFPDCPLRPTAGDPALVPPQLDPNAYPVFDLAVTFPGTFVLPQGSPYRLRALWSPEVGFTVSGYSSAFEVTEPAGPVISCQARADFATDQGSLRLPIDGTTSCTWSLALPASSTANAGPQSLWVTFPAIYLDAGDELMIFDGPTADPKSLLRTVGSTSTRVTSADDLLSRTGALTMQLQRHARTGSSWKLAVSWLAMPTPAITSLLLSRDFFVSYLVTATPGHHLSDPCFSAVILVSTPAVISVNDLPANVYKGDHVVISWNTTLYQGSLFPMMTRLWAVAQGTSVVDPDALGSVTDAGPFLWIARPETHGPQKILVEAIVPGWPAIFGWSNQFTVPINTAMAVWPWILLGCAVAVWALVVPLGVWSCRCLQSRRAARMATEVRQGLLTAA